MKNLAALTSSEDVLARLAALKSTHGPSAMLYVVETSTASAIDIVFNDNGEARLGYSKDLLATYLEKNTEHRVMDATELHALLLAMHRRPVQEISEDDFNYALEVLPPLDYRASGGYLSFKMSEFYTADITSIYVRDPEGRCFKFQDQASTSAEDCVQRVISYKTAEGEGAIKKPTSSSPGL